MRWKQGYYFDINANNVVLVDKNGKKYNFIDGDKNFYEVFPPDGYIPKDSFLPIKVLEVRGILLTIKNDPKVLIEGNETLLKILIDN